MNATSEMSDPPISNLTSNAIFSPGSADGVSHCASQDGPTIDPSGPAVAPVNLSAREAAALGLLTSGTCGPHGSTSSHSASLQSFLANRSAAWKGLHGGTLYTVTCRWLDTPAQQRIFALRASALTISDSGFFGWPTPAARDWKSSASNKHGINARPLNEVARLSGLIAYGSPARTGKPGQLNPAHSRWLMGYPVVWDLCGGTAMRSFHGSRPISSKFFRNSKTGK